MKSLVNTKKVLFVFLLLSVIGFSTTSCSSNANKAKPKVELSSRDVSKKVGADVAFISNDYVSGSGIVLKDGYILTNQHVIDGFASMNVSLESGKEFNDVKVYAQYPELDLALLGPISHKGSLDFSNTEDMQKGDEIYFVGYPDETDDKPVTTITKGIVSRIRSSKKPFTKYLQTDSAIAGGQSGGAMVNKYGEVIGISELGDESFGYALANENIQEGLRIMRSKRSLPSATYPLTLKEASKGKQENAISLINRYDSVKFVGYTKNKTTLKLSSSDKKPIALSVSDLNAEISKSSTLYDSVSNSFSDIDINDPTFENVPEDPEYTVKQDSSGAYNIELPEDTSFYVEILSDSFDNNNYSTNLISSLPLTKVVTENVLTQLKVGKTKYGVLESLEAGRMYSIDLEKDTTYKFSVTSRIGDASFVLVKDGGKAKEDWFIDDAEKNGGILGTDAIKEIDINESGKYLVLVPPSYDSALQYSVNVSKVK
ncbi:MAG: serine protease [Acidimicrobiia bacterium]